MKRYFFSVNCFFSLLFFLVAGWMGREGRGGGCQGWELLWSWPETGEGRVGARRVGAQNFALFFLPLPATIFFLSSLSWGSLRGILVVFVASRDAEMCTFGSFQFVVSGGPPVIQTICEAPSASFLLIPHRTLELHLKILHPTVQLCRNQTWHWWNDH